MSHRMTNDQLSQSLQEKFPFKKYDRSFYENAISECRKRQMIDELEFYRIELAKRFVLKPGQLMEWLSDSCIYEEQLSAERLLRYEQACIEAHNHNCWSVLLKLLIASNRICFDTKLKHCGIVLSHGGRILGSGHVLWFEYFAFLEEHSLTEKIKQEGLDRMIKIPYAKMQEILDKLERVGKVSKRALTSLLKIVPEVRNYEDRYNELTAEEHNLYFQVLEGIEDRSILMAEYQRYLLRHPEDEEVWWKFLGYSELLVIWNNIGLARKICPEQIQFWIYEALLVDQSLAKDFYAEALSAIRYFYGKDSAEVLLVAKEYVGSAWRISNGNFDRFALDIAEFIKDINPRSQLVFEVLILAARFLFSRQQFQLGRLLMEQLKEAKAQDCTFWLEYARLEVSADPSKARSHFIEGFTALKTENPIFVSAWVDFERIHGSLEQYRDTRLLIFSKFGCEPSKKRLRHQDQHALPQISARRTKEEPPAALDIEVAPQKELTVFVNNIDFSVSEDQLKEFFETRVGPVKEVHLGRKGSGESRGFANVEFTIETSVEEALKLDRSRINGRPLFISRYQIVGGKQWAPPVPKHSQRRDARVLYVSQLPRNAIEDDLKALFSLYNGFETVRLGLNKDGSCKGFAYVQFMDESQASAALGEHGKIVKGQPISVLISDPSLAPKLQLQKTAMVPKAARARSKIQVQATPGDKDVIQVQTTPADEAVGNADAKSAEKSNDDFRKMLGL